MIKILCNDVWGLTVEEIKQLSDEEQYKLVTVNIKTPNGENIELYYSPKKSGNSDDGCIYSYQITQNGNYTFKATNSKGRSSEITVPVELDESKIKTFTLEISETETKTFSFVEGQTWEDFIGEDNIITIDGVEFNKKSNCIIIGSNSTTGYIQNGIKVASLGSNYKIAKRHGENRLYIKNGDSKTRVLPTDKIVANGEYCHVFE